MTGTRDGDCIRIDGVQCVGIHGVLPQERLAPQRFLVDLELGLDTTKASYSDNLDDTVDYDRVASMVAAEVSGKSYNLIETLAESIATALLGLKTPRWVWVKVSKPDAPLGVAVSNVSVAITRFSPPE